MDQNPVISCETPSEALVPDTAEFLRIAFQGSDEEWFRLHQACESRLYAEALLEALSRAPKQHRPQADHWLAAICELHPDITRNSRKVFAAQRTTPATAPEEPAGHGPGFLAQCRSLPALFARFVSPRHGL